ncbi:MAG: ATP-binding protein [Bacteroidota bacterium]
MSSYSLPSLLTIGINISLVIIVLLDNLRSRAHRLFALLIFCFALWGVADVVVVNSSTPDSAAIGGAIMVAALLFASTFFLLLSFSFPCSIHSRFDRLPVRPLFLVLPLLFSILAGLGLFQPLELHRFTAQGVYCYVVNTSGGVLDAAMFATVLGHLSWGVGNLVVQLRGTQVRKERYRIGTILLGTVGFAVLVILLDVLRHHEAVHFYASRILFLLISVSFAYAVLGNRLLVLRRLGKQGLAYSVVTGLIFAFYLIVIKNISETLGKQLDVDSVVLEVLLILLLALAFRPLIVRIQSLVENLFSQSMFRRRQQFIRFSRALFHITSLPELAAAVRKFLMETLSASDGIILVAGEEVRTMPGVLPPHQTLRFDDDLMRLLADDHKPREVAEVLRACAEEQKGTLEPFTGGYLVPLLGEKGPVGMLLVGPKKSSRPYTFDDEEFLAVFANEVALGVERNRLLERMRAEELRAAQNEKLAALGRLTAGIAHEFRNPLNIIATSAQTILRNPDNGKLHQETGRYILEETDRLNRTVEEFLQFAKPHTPVWEEVNLVEVIDNVMAALQPRGDASGVRIRKEICESLPPVTTSPRHLERALMNLGLNAVEAMTGGGELVLTAGRRDERIVVAVRDTGGGIPPEFHTKIFDPFYTTKQAGTGLGLPIVYMMVHAIGGEISFVSGTGGTTFSIELPIAGIRQ